MDINNKVQIDWGFTTITTNQVNTITLSKSFSKAIYSIVSNIRCSTRQGGSGVSSIYVYPQTISTIILVHDYVSGVTNDGAFYLVVGT